MSMAAIGKIVNWAGTSARQQTERGKLQVGTFTITTGVLFRSCSSTHINPRSAHPRQPKLKKTPVVVTCRFHTSHDYLALATTPWQSLAVNRSFLAG